MNSREELLEVMARAANPEAWFWCKEYDTFELAKKANYGRLEYSLAQSNRHRAIEKQRRALEAIEAKGARVGPVEATDEMSQAGGEAQCIVNCNGHYSQPDGIYEVASPFAPEKKR